MRIAGGGSYFSFMGILYTPEIFQILNGAEIPTPDYCWWDLGPLDLCGIFSSPNVFTGPGFPILVASHP